MGYFGKALSISASDTISSLPAWEFMNQSGTLGTNLVGSSVYVGGAGAVNVIVAGTVGAQDAAQSLDITTAGTGYTAAVGVATTGGTGTGLTITTTAPGAPGPVTVAAIAASGSGYTVGDVITITGGGGDATLTLTSVRDLLPVVADGVLFSGLAAGDMLPVNVDYVLATSTVGSLLVAVRNET